MRNSGYSAILESEFPKGNRIRVCDAFINGVSAEIKTVERAGRWSVRTKIYDAIHKGAEVIVLYYPDSAVFSKAKVEEGCSYNNLNDTRFNLRMILAVYDGEVHIIKPPG